MEYLLETDNITKRYGPVTAVDHVSIRLKQGEIYGLIGRNGAGKTTLLKMLAGLFFLVASAATFTVVVTKKEDEQE